MRRTRNASAANEDEMRTINLSVAEKHALVEAAAAFEGHGIDFRFPWECDLDDLETERYVALIDACRAYAKKMPVNCQAPKLNAVVVTDGMIDRALNAWFASPPSETDQGLERSMRAALEAALVLEFEQNEDGKC